MALLKLKQKRNDGVSYIDNRGSLYYSKHRYRARVHATGVNVLWFAKDEKDLINRLKGHPKRFANADEGTLIKIFNWINANPKKKCNYALRIESNVAAFFSNDLDFLKTLETTGAEIDYTEIDESIPEGTKYFVNEPKHKYRVYLKSKRMPEDFNEKLRDFFARYEKTDTKMSPSRALRDWIKPVPSNLTSWASWKRRYCSSSYFFDYDNESTLTLFMLVFDGIISKKFKLEKRPD